MRKLVALPVQVIEIPDGVVLKRGASKVIIRGAKAADSIRIVLDATRGDGAFVGKLRRLLTRSVGKQADSIISNLQHRRLLVPTSKKTRSTNGQEDIMDSLYWQFGGTTGEVRQRLNKVHLAIIGVNHISRQLAISLMSCHFNNFIVLDHPQFRNFRMFDKTGRLKKGCWPTFCARPHRWKARQTGSFGDCLIVTSDFGGKQALREWNALCLDRALHFMPVMLDSLVGHVGPMVIPGSTACYECLLCRQRSQSSFSETEMLIDQAAYDGQEVMAFHPCMASILGELAAFEIVRFYGNILPDRKVGWLLEVDLLATSMTRRPVIKVPRCPACSPLRNSSQTNTFNNPISEWATEWVKVE